MSVPFSNTKLRVPPGFQNLLEGFAREVLRSQPADIYQFGSLYFNELLKQREETGEDDLAKLGAKLEDRFYNNNTFKTRDIDVSNPQHQDAAVKIQTGYRRHAAIKEVEILREDQAATTIQAGFRGHQEREKVSELRKSAGHGNDVPSDQRTDDNEQVDIDLDDPEVAYAASKIQAGFKGYKARKEVAVMKMNKEKDIDEAAKVPGGAIDLTDPDMEQAALKIQAGFKGYQTRRELSALKKQSQSDLAVEENDESPQSGANDDDLNDQEVAELEAEQPVSTDQRVTSELRELEAVDEPELHEATEEIQSEIQEDTMDAQNGDEITLNDETVAVEKQEEAPAEEAPAEEAPAEEAPAEEAPAEEAPAEEDPAEESPTEEAPAEEAAAEEAPAEETLAEEAPAEEAPAEEAPSEEAPAEEAPAEEAPAEEAPAEEAPAEEAPAEEAPAEEAPAEEAPSEEAPAEEAPAEEVPSEETPAEESPAEEQVVEADVEEAFVKKDEAETAEEVVVGEEESAPEESHPAEEVKDETEVAAE